MLTQERRHRVLELVRLRGGFASLTDLAEELGVSESTVRRDLDFLEETGAAKRTHGGVFYTGDAPKPPYAGEGEPAQWDKKKAIAQRAKDLIEDNDTLLLDGGSTTYELARVLVGRPLQIVTNSLPVANLFAADAYVDLVLTGGYVYPRTGVMLGPHADRTLKEINVRRTILSVAGVTDRGFYNNNVLLVETERAMLQAADEIIVLADSTKFDRQGLVHLCELSAVDRLVADEGISPEWRKKIQHAGVELIVASAERPKEN